MVCLNCGFCKKKRDPIEEKENSKEKGELFQILIFLYKTNCKDRRKRLLIRVREKERERKKERKREKERKE